MGKLFLFGKLILLLVMPLTVLGSDISPRDTMIVTYWRNGNKKTETVYRKKIIQNKDDGSSSMVLKAKRTRYYDSWGESTSKEDFDFFYARSNFMDSVEYTITERSVELRNRPSVRIILSDSVRGLRFPINITFNPKTELYQEKDTLIGGKAYSICIYRKDTLNAATGMAFAGALRSDAYKVYYYDHLTGKEELAVDYKAEATELGKAALDGLSVFVEAVTGAVSTGSKMISSASAAALGHSLKNVIFILK